ncbi:MAG: hypothetical protein JSU03_13275 [Bacteroidetes bacterium]|nr:hypothetical protein [Bacteroidota bacterium]MBS1758240.1 hypothetical protein [Bacteroidota bacterium]
MKAIIFLMMLTVITTHSNAQKQAFDVVNFTIPQGWDKTESENGVQLSTKDDGKGSYAAALILRSVSSAASSNENFSNGWKSLVKGTVKVTEEPAMQSPEIQNGWSIISGQANYQDGSNKGLVTLITATGNGKVANVVLLTNTNKYQNELLAFINSLEINEPATAQNNSLNPSEKSVSETPSSTNNTTGSKGIYSITPPPTWSLNANTANIMLEKNTTAGKRTIEFMNPIKSTGNLEKDMEHIFFEVFDGWELHNSPNNLLFENGNHEKGFTCQGLPYYMLSNSISKKVNSNGDVINGTVLLIQEGNNVAIINSADNILGSEVEMALHFLLFNLKINGVAEKNLENKKLLIGTWGTNSGLYGNSLSTVTNYSTEGKYSVLIQSSYTVGYDYYNDLIKKKQFNSAGSFSLIGNLLLRTSASGSKSKYYIRFYSRKYGNYPWEDLMSLYEYDFDKTKINSVLHFHKIN